MLSLAFAIFATLFISASDAKTKINTGYNPGEMLPSIKVDDIDLQDIGTDNVTLVVLWSKRDPKSRMVNSWLSHKGVPDKVISVCIDANTEEAKQYASIDGVSPEICIKGTNQSKKLVKELGMSKGLKTLTIENGVIVNSTGTAVLWDQLENIEK